MRTPNYIGIDPSLISTAITIETYKETKIFNFYKDKKLSKWEKLAEGTINMILTNFKDYKKMKYSEEQLAKHKDYLVIIETITETILNNIDKSQETFIGMEGFSYGSGVGPLIDLVTFSTLLRNNLLKYVSNNIIILTPGELKKGCAMIAYNKGEDGDYRNNEIQEKSGKGLAGGSFKKHDMARALIDYYGRTGIIINKQIHDFLMGYKDDIFSMKGFAKPFDDIIDSIWVKEVLKVKLNTLN